MAKSSSIKGVTQKNGYWYARVDGTLKYCGKGDKGFNMAKAARQKWEVKQYEQRQVLAGLKVKTKVHLRTVKDLANWYMEIPSIQDQKSFSRKIIGVANLVGYFGKEPLNAIESIEQEYYRAYRVKQGVAPRTVDLEISFLSAMYRKAVKEKKIPADFLPGEFIRTDEKIQDGL